MAIASGVRNHAARCRFVRDRGPVVEIDSDSEPEPPGGRLDDDNARYGEGGPRLIGQGSAAAPIELD